MNTQITKSVNTFIKLIVVENVSCRMRGTCIILNLKHFLKWSFQIKIFEFDPVNNFKIKGGSWCNLTMMAS